MKRLIISFTVLAFLIGIPASHYVLGKGHVPLHKVQVCHKGETITVSADALKGHLDHGDCQLPACDFANVFHTGDACDSNNPGGQCSVPNARNDACGRTPGCPAGPDCF